MEVDLGDGRVDLKFKTSSLGELNPFQRALKGPFHLSKGIVGLRSGAIEADADSLNPRVLHFLNRLFGNQGPVGGHHHSKSLIRSILGEIEDIGSEEGFPPCEDDDGFADRGNLIHHPEAFLGGKFSWVRAPFGRGAAVDAGKVATASQFPGHHSQFVSRR
jgi:hypothetical protein